MAVKKCLVVRPRTNQIKVDATGAFIPESEAFMRVHKDSFDFTLFEFTPKDLNKDEFFRVLSGENFDALAIFSHGLWDRLPQLEIRIADIPEFVSCLQCRKIILIFYCCLLAQPRTERNFAETMRDNLLASGYKFNLYAHRTAGHTTKNPQITHFSNDFEQKYPEQLMSYDKKFTRAMRDSSNPMRFIFPFEFAVWSPENE